VVVLAGMQLVGWSVGDGVIYVTIGDGGDDG
jgi:hypothetical protein